MTKQMPGKTAGNGKVLSFITSYSNNSNSKPFMDLLFNTVPATSLIPCFMNVRNKDDCIKDPLQISIT